MGRLQLFEIHDATWCPRGLRDSLTALMRWAIDLLRVYDPALPLLLRLLERARTREVVDLCSGGAGPWRRLGAALDRLAGAPVPVLLSDKYPNIAAFERLREASGGRVDFIAGSVDATAVPGHLGGVRTLFSSFHHFPPPVARQILRDAAEKGVPIGIFEFTERSVFACLAMLFTPIVALLIVPFLRPFTPWRALSCVPLPILPLLATWDGLVSNLRTYSPAELAALTAGIEIPGYRWESGRIPGGATGLAVTYLLGLPESAPTRAEGGRSGAVPRDR